MYFAQGPYGEILPSPLVAGLDPEICLVELATASEALGSPVDMPTRGNSRQGMVRLAWQYAQQKQLIRALSGHLMDNPDGAELYYRVTLGQEPLSLRPLGMEGLQFQTFAPVLRRVGERAWQLGLAEHGRTHTIHHPDTTQAVQKAMQLRAQWAEEENTAIRTHLLDNTRQQPLHPIHWVWEQQLRQGAPVIVGQRCLTPLGKHTTYQLETAKGTRILDIPNRLRAAQVLFTLCEEHPPPPPTVAQAESALLAKGAVYPTNHKKGWQMVWPSGLIVRVVATGQILHLAKQKERYQLTRQGGVVSLKNGHFDKRRPPPLSASRFTRTLHLPSNWTPSQQSRISLIWAGLEVISR